MNDWPSIIGLPLWGWLFVLPSLVVLGCFYFRAKTKILLLPLFRFLDRVYDVSGIFAAGFLVLILLIIVAQMIARWSGLQFEGSTEFAGYAMAATSFFALGYTLTRGAHIRVSIFLNMTGFTRLWLNAFAMYIAALTATYFARYAVKTNFLSEVLNDRTQGQDQVPEWLISLFSMFATVPWEWAALWAKSGGGYVYTPIWLPQIAMSIGTIMLALALWDHLIRLLLNGESAIRGETVA